MAADDFAQELRALGYEVEVKADGKITIPFVIDEGRFAGQKVALGFEAPADYNFTCPGGPHVSPRLLPQGGGSDYPTGGIHESAFGSDWQYWSRPFSGWANERTARAYMRHIRRLFADVA